MNPDSSVLDRAFVTLAADSEHRLDVKGSVFLAYARRVDRVEQVGDFLNALSQRHADASHLCWAYRIGHQYRYSDGGEPGGTAGQPIMRAIEGQALDHVAIGVIRYFGGTLLGAGGLMRAYGGAAAEVLRHAGRIQESPAVEVVIESPFQWLGAIHHLIERHDAVKQQESYTEHGVSLTCLVTASNLNAFQDALRGATHDQALLRCVSRP
jgi:uncharacterized YigZ family protein